MNMKKHNATRPACGFSVLRVHVLKLKIEDFLVKCGSGNVNKWIQHTLIDKVSYVARF